MFDFQNIPDTKDTQNTSAVERSLAKLKRIIAALSVALAKRRTTAFERCSFTIRRFSETPGRLLPLSHHHHRQHHAA